MHKRFVVVTPSFNTADYLDSTILSVASQEGPFEIDYHIQDGGSTDGTVAKLEAWAQLLSGGGFPIRCAGLRFSYAVAPDRGMYDAIATGFDRLVAGDQRPAWMTYINASDQILPNALCTVMVCGAQFPQFRWITGRRVLIDADGAHMLVNWLASYPRRAIRDGLQLGTHLGFVQQEGTSWTTELWHEAGGTLRRDLRAAGDFELWTRLAHHADLLVVDGALGAFRFHSDQLSADQDRYYVEAAQALGADGVHRQTKSWADWKTALNAGDVEAMVEGGFTGPVLLYDWNTRTRRLTHRLPMPYARIPAMEPILPRG